MNELVEGVVIKSYMKHLFSTFFIELGYFHLVL